MSKIDDSVKFFSEQIEKKSIRSMIRSLGATLGITPSLSDDEAIYCIYKACESYLERRGLLVNVP